jgi:pyruvate dehydrogenase E2 component (dihydrolipoamide acetyltransferase)
MAKIIEMPKLGFDMAEGTLMNWVKAEGDKVEKGETLAEIETDKATVQVESSESGVVFKHLAAPNATLPVGAPIAVISAPGETVDLDALLGGSPTAVKKEKTEETVPASPIPETPINETVEPETPAAPGLESAASVKASPLAKALARDRGIDLAALTGSGPGGRVVKRDVEAALNSAKPPAAVSFPAFAPGQDRALPLSKLRAAIGRRMQESKRSIPAFYLTRSIDVQDLVKMRRQMNESREKDAKISLNDFLVRAAALALRQYPNLNASLDGNNILQHGDINIGVAVALEQGLLTVVLRNADRKSVEQIAAESGRLVRAAREGKLRNEDIAGSTFTISNLGMYDIEEFIAIVNPPEAAILAVGSALEVPVVVNGSLQAGWRMKATLSADHRVTDGAEAAQFLQALALFLEQPWRLLVA